MRVTIQIQMQSPWLGDVSVEPGMGKMGADFKPTQRPAYAFRRHPKDSSLLLVDQEHWAWAWAEAFASVGGDAHFHSEAVRLDTYMLKPTIGIMTRHYRLVGSKTHHVAYHQCIHPRTKLTIGAEIVQPSPHYLGRFASAVTQPSVEVIMQALGVIGASIGMSSFMSAQGYGRFIPVEINTGYAGSDLGVGPHESEHFTVGSEPGASAQSESEEPGAAEANG